MPPLAFTLATAALTASATSGCVMAPVTDEMETILIGSPDSCAVLALVLVDDVEAELLPLLEHADANPPTNKIAIAIAIPRRPFTSLSSTGAADRKDTAR
jgi:hypothetical protein